MSVGAGPARRVRSAPQRVAGRDTPGSAGPPERPPEALRLALAVAGMLAVVAAALTWGQVVVRLRAPEPVETHGTPEAMVWSGRVFRSEAELAVWLHRQGVDYEHWARTHPAAVAILREPAPSLAEASRRTRAANAVEPTK